jgi:ACS family sodium-dependent inorganic phosphate cotransporter-like MFS transporter 9
VTCHSINLQLNFIIFLGFMGVYLAGYILETTNSWSSVFQITAAINMFGCMVFLMFGSGNAII